MDIHNRVLSVGLRLFGQGCKEVRGLSGFWRVRSLLVGLLLTTCIAIRSWGVWACGLFFMF